MTWKKLFFKLTLHDMKKRSWCMILFFVFWFLAIPVSALLSIQNRREFYGAEASLEYQTAVGELFEQSIFDFGKFTSIFFLTAGAVILATTGFSYLNSRKKVDFMHSMPVKRETLFLSRYTAGIMLYITPLVLNVGIGLLISVMTKGCNIYVVKNAFCFLLYHLVYFLLFYGTSVLAVVLAGNLVVSLLGMGVLFTYQTVFWFIIVNLKENFFQTYMRIYQTFHVFDPAGLLIRQIMSFHNNYFTYDYKGDKVRIGAEGYYSTGWEVCLAAFILALVIGGAALMLFRFRKSESAGKSLAFPRLEPVAKAAIMLPAGLIGGMVFYGMAAGYRKLWYAFGAVLFCVLSALVMEIIFRQDFKSLLKHKKASLAGGVLVLVVTLCFWLDIFGFDSWIPKSGQIASVGVSIPRVDNQGGVYISDENMNYASEPSIMRMLLDSKFYVASEKANPVMYNCRITGEGIEQVRKLAACFANNKLEFERVKRSNSAGLLDIWTGRYRDPDAEYEQFVECQVVYRLKNGKNVYRTYRMANGEELLEVIEPVFANKEYRKGADPFFQDEENYRYLIAGGNFTEKRIQIAQSDKKELLECMKKDRDKLTFQDAWLKNKCGYFSMINNLGSKQSGTCFIYEGYTNTLNWLKEHKAGIETEPGDVEIISGSVEYYRNNDGYYKSFELEDEQEKEELIPYLIRGEFVAPIDQINPFYSMEAVIEYTVKQDEGRIPGWGNEYWGESGNDKQMDTFYLKDAPPFIKEFFGG